MKIGLLGYGSLGKQVHFLLKEITELDDAQLTIFDDILNPTPQDTFSVRPFQSVYDDEFANHAVYICLRYHHLELRQNLIEKLLTKKYSLPNLIHPSVCISEHAKIGNANIIFSGTTIDMFTTIGDGNIFYNQTNVAHDVKIENCNFFAPSVTICGNTVVGNLNFVGARVAIANSLSIGDRNKIGIGSVITKNINSNISGVGFPFKAICKDLDIK